MGGGSIDETFSDATVDQVDLGGELCVAFSSGGAVEEIPFPHLSELSIGRSSRCDVRIDDPSVSRKHALLRRSTGIQIKDLASSNGIFVGGKRLEADQWVTLRPGESVTIGAGFLIVRPQPTTARPRRIWSHGYFEGRVEEECERSRRGGGEFAVLRLSTPARIAPERVEQSLADWARASDVLARYAPLEYEVLFVDLSPDLIEVAVHRLLKGLADALDADEGAFSHGVACYPRDERSADELISRANEALRGARAEAGDSAIIQPAAVRDELERVADSNMNVLILGETGVGKEVCAEQLHKLSSRRDYKLLRLNCAALAETLLESELFGYVKGAFTGATHPKPGLFETADHGTVFLDEIGEMPLATQVKLLRVLEEREVQRIGALEPVAIDVRFLAATNRDLDAEVLAGRFRQDLLFRINTFTLHLPPLRERPDEIEPLAHQFAARAARDLGKSSAPVITKLFLTQLLRYQWPGNIRELRNVMERAVVLSRGGDLEPQHLPLDKMHATISRAAPMPAARGPEPTDRELEEEFRERPTMQHIKPPSSSLRSDVEEFERQRIIDALDECAGNQTRAAKMLGISRGRLIKRLDRYDIPRPRKK